MSLVTPELIQALQRKLYLKAKQEPTYRFYALYDKVCRQDILVHAYRLAKANGGAPGGDGIRFEDIESYGEERFLVELRQELQERRYRPDAVLRVMIPKAGGGERPLGIPTIEQAGVRFKSFGNTGSREVYLGKPDLGVGGNRNEVDFTWAAGTYDVSFSYNPATVQLTTVGTKTAPRSSPRSPLSARVEPAVRRFA